MDETLRAVVIVVATVISAPFILAGIRAFIFFGELSGTIKRTESKLDQFIEKSDRLFVEHDRDIQTLKTEVKFGRRAGDHLDSEASNA